MFRKNQKGERNKPILYSEKKERCCFYLTLTSNQILDDLARNLGISRSEVVEQFLRQSVNSLQATTVTPYKESKDRFYLCLTPTSIHILDALSKKRQTSRSKLIEQFLRHESNIALLDQEQVAV